tara:strand:+ start:181 stop:426 length:246 start_codon:yes stop_codon:yes gene_type:complete
MKFDIILPKNKIQAQGMERLFGITFQQEGFDVINSLQGDINNAKLNKTIISDKHSRKFVKFDKNKKLSVCLKVWENYLNNL